MRSALALCCFAEQQTALGELRNQMVHVPMLERAIQGRMTAHDLIQRIGRHRLAPQHAQNQQFAPRVSCHRRLEPIKAARDLSEQFGFGLREFFCAEHTRGVKLAEIFELRDRRFG